MLSGSWARALEDRTQAATSARARGARTRRCRDDPCNKRVMVRPTCLSARRRPDLVSGNPVAATAGAPRLGRNTPSYPYRRRVWVDLKERGKRGKRNGVRHVLLDGGRRS